VGGGGNIRFKRDWQYKFRRRRRRRRRRSSSSSSSSSGLLALLIAHARTHGEKLDKQSLVLKRAFLNLARIRWAARVFSVPLTSRPGFLPPTALITAQNIANFRL
jgi:hypothetical protein